MKLKLVRFVIITIRNITYSGCHYDYEKHVYYHYDYEKHVYCHYDYEKHVYSHYD